MYKVYTWVCLCVCILAVCGSQWVSEETDTGVPKIPFTFALIILHWIIHHAFIHSDLQILWAFRFRLRNS